MGLELLFSIIVVIYCVGAYATVRDAFYGLRNPGAVDICIGILIAMWWPFYWLWLGADYFYHKTRERLRF